MFICIAYVHFDRIARDPRAIRSWAAAYVVHVRWAGRVEFELEAALVRSLPRPCAASARPKQVVEVGRSGSPAVQRRAVR